MNAQPPPPPPGSAPAAPPPPPPPGGAPAAPHPPLRPPPPHIPSSELRPSVAWFWVAGAIGVVCTGLSVLLFISFFSSLVDDLTGPLTELRAPGKVTLELDAGAERTIYRQERVDGRPVPGASGRDPACEVTRQGGGVVELNDTLFPWTLTRSGGRYEAMFAFTAPDDGSYLVSCSPSGNGDARLPLAIGESIGFLDLVKKGGGALALFFGGLIVAGAIAITTGVMRSNHKTRLQRERRAASAPPPPPPTSSSASS